jgi:hypothetical protein
MEYNYGGIKNDGEKRGFLVKTGYLMVMHLVCQLQKKGFQYVNMDK